MFFPFVSKLNSFIARQQNLARGLVYAGLVGLFLWICSQFYLPGKGFTYLIEFGDQEEARYLPELRAIDHYELRDSPGYDAQAYAQIAMRPRLSDPALRRAVDNLPYRARRILFCWTAYALAGGDPVRALNIYAVQNIICWLLLAGLLCRWFPPTRWDNLLRWAGVLFSFGLCVSVRGSLVDGPSLLLIAGAMVLLESGRAGLSAALFGLAGLGRETNVLAAVAALGPAAGRKWGRTLGLLALALLPLLGWTLILSHWLGGAGTAGARNFSYPFVGYFGKWAEIARTVANGPHWMIRGTLLIQTALTVQWLFFALRPRWRDPWWRVGAVYAALLVILGAAVWENYPGAAARVLLPMTLAFNILVPRGRAWLGVLLLGNLSIFALPDALPLPGRESFTVAGPRELRVVPATGQAIEAVFDSQWYPPEKSWLEYWRWSRGPATLVWRNPHPIAVTARISFGLRADDRRHVILRQGATERWRGTLEPGVLQRVVLPHVALAPGDTSWSFATDLPPRPPSRDDHRPVAFSVRDLKIDLR